MRYVIAVLFVCATVSWAGMAAASDLPARSDIEAVCDKFGPTNKEFCELVLGIYDAVDDIDSRLGDVESKLDRIPEHPHPAFGHEAMKRDMSDLHAGMAAGMAGLEKMIGRIPEHPHPAFGYESAKRDIAELRAAIEELKAKSN